DGLRGELYAHERGIYVIPAAGGEPRRVTDSGSQPRFDRSGDRIYLIGSAEERTTLERVDLSSGERQVLLSADAASEIVPSPDDRYVAVVERYNAYLAPLPLTGRTVQFSPTTTDYPVQR